jgi:hypothetical protein
MVQEANAGSRKATGKRDSSRSFQRLFRITGRTQAWCLARKGADVDQVSL